MQRIPATWDTEHFQLLVQVKWILFYYSLSNPYLKSVRHCCKKKNVMKYYLMQRVFNSINYKITKKPQYQKKLLELEEPLIIIGCRSPWFRSPCPTLQPSLHATRLTWPPALLSAFAQLSQIFDASHCPLPEVPDLIPCNQILSPKIIFLQLELQNETSHVDLADNR